MEEITAQYHVESFTFYSDIESILHHHEASKEEKEGDVGGGMMMTTDKAKDHSAAAAGVTVQIQYASSSRGGSIVSAQHDTTGLFLWPATYLLCQYLLLEYHQLLRLMTIHSQQHYLDHQKDTTTTATTTMNILELGCGCGMVSSVFMKYHHHQLLQQQQQSLSSLPTVPVVVHWYATDMDTNALDLTHHNNHVLNQIPCAFSRNNNNNNNSSSSSNNDSDADHQNHIKNESSTTIVQQLSWGNDNDIQAIREILRQQQQQPQLEDETPPLWGDVIVAADIIYPTQDRTVLQLLFDTFRALLRPGGTVILSYCHRDPTDQTLWNFIEAATAAHFIMTAPPDRHDIYHPILRRYLPPLMDAQIVLLQRASDLATAQAHNEALGRDDCRIFPGRQTRRQQRQEHVNDDDNWDAPPVDFHTEYMNE